MAINFSSPKLGLQNSSSLQTLFEIAECLLERSLKVAKLEGLFGTFAARFIVAVTSSEVNAAPL